VVAEQLGAQVVEAETETEAEEEAATKETTQKKLRAVEETADEETPRKQVSLETTPRPVARSAVGYEEQMRSK
jgi:hypothetical protein